jgi:hypothetical protein
MITEYPVEIELQLTPVGLPWVQIQVANHTQQLQLTHTKTFKFNFSAAGSQSIVIKHYDKHITDRDTAVVIDRVSFFGIQNPKFVWHGQYRPEYPEPWFSQQQPPPQSVLTNVTYLGWNGVWYLEFTVPVFTWMHQVQDFGWIYN